LIFTDGTTTYWENCDNGAIRYSSTSVAGVINDAIGNLTGGGEVFVKAGIYTLTTDAIELLSNVTVIGEGSSTIFVNAMPYHNFYTPKWGAHRGRDEPPVFFTQGASDVRVSNMRLSPPSLESFMGLMVSIL
jgi:hypothetical protein